MNFETVFDPMGLEKVVRQGDQHEWADNPQGSRGNRTDIGYWTTRDDGEKVFIPLFETRTNAKRADVLAVVYLHNNAGRMFDLLRSLIAENDLLRAQLQDAKPAPAPAQGQE